MSRELQAGEFGGKLYFLIVASRVVINYLFRIFFIRMIAKELCVLLGPEEA
jgi:hypothetical protein